MVLPLGIFNSLICVPGKYLQNNDSNEPCISLLSFSLKMWLILLTHFYLKGWTIKNLGPGGVVIEKSSYSLTFLQRLSFLC